MDPGEAAQAAWAIPILLKWVLGALWAAVVGAFTWMWATDRAVRSHAQTFAQWREQEKKERAEQRDKQKAERAAREKREEEERAERKEWRDAVMTSIQRLGERVGPLELERARQQGREEARKEQGR